MVDRYKIPDPEIMRQLRPRGKWKPSGRGMGRPKGSKSKTTTKIQEAAARSGLLPHVFMLIVSRAKVGQIVSNHKVTWDDIRWAAEKSVGYFASRHAAIDITNRNGPAHVIQLDPVALSKMTPKEVESLLAKLLQVQGTIINAAVDNRRDITGILALPNIAPASDIVARTIEGDLAEEYEKTL